MNLICETCVRRQRDVNEFCPKQLPKEGESCQQYHEADWSKIKQLQAENEAKDKENERLRVALRYIDGQLYTLVHTEGAVRRCRSHLMKATTRVKQALESEVKK